MERRRDIEDIIRRAGRVLADAEAVRVAEAALEAAIDNFRGAMLKSPAMSRGGETGRTEEAGHQQRHY